MTQPATLNGQVIGQAERATRAVLETHTERAHAELANAS